jgi:hypothetical protein
MLAATALTPLLPSHPLSMSSKRHLSRNATIAVAVVVFHAGGLYALQSGLLSRAIEVGGASRGAGPNRRASPPQSRAPSAPTPAAQSEATTGGAPAQPQPPAATAHANSSGISRAHPQCGSGCHHPPATRTTCGGPCIGRATCATRPATHPAARQQRRLPEQPATRLPTAEQAPG